MIIPNSVPLLSRWLSQPDQGKTYKLMIGKKARELKLIHDSHRSGTTAPTRLLTGRRSFVWATLVLVATAALCPSQTIISAHSGTLNYFEGDVSVDGTPLQSKLGRFSDLKEQSVLRTAQGRAEMLLTPGVFLRVGENSAVKMLDNRLVSTRIEILSGTVIAESEDPQVSLRDSPIALIYDGVVIQLVKYGLMEISSDSAQMKVYRGEAAVDIPGAGSAGKRATVKKGQLLTLSAELFTGKFDDKICDELYLWARDRAQKVSAANMSLERSSGEDGSSHGYHTVVTLGR